LKKMRPIDRHLFAGDPPALDADDRPGNVIRM
jgi:hypothetical protein